MYKEYPTKRYHITMDLVKQYINKDAKVLDLGVKNPFSDLMVKEGYHVINTDGTDLDLHPEILQSYDYDFVTGFEILEHLVNPFGVLQQIKANKALFTVPLNLWFAKPYRNKLDARDWHYHEFVDWQFDLLLNKSGWNIKYRKKWTNPVNKIGLRPILRSFTPRYYAVYTEKT